MPRNFFFFCFFFRVFSQIGVDRRDQSTPTMALLINWDCGIVWTCSGETALVLTTSPSAVLPPVQVVAAQDSAALRHLKSVSPGAAPAEMEFGTNIIILVKFWKLSWYSCASFFNQLAPIYQTQKYPSSTHLQYHEQAVTLFIPKRWEDAYPADSGHWRVFLSCWDVNFILCTYVLIYLYTFYVYICAHFICVLVK